MKHSNPFWLACCLLVALGVLLAGFGVPDSGKALSPCATVSSETAGAVEEGLLSETGDAWYAVIFSDEFLGSHLASTDPAPRVRNGRIQPVQSAGWRLPIRI